MLLKLQLGQDVTRNYRPVHRKVYGKTTVKGLKAKRKTKNARSKTSPYETDRQVHFSYNIKMI